MAEIEPDRLAYVDRRRNMLKLTQSEFVAATRLEAVYAGAPLIHQIFMHRYSERSSLLAVVVPTPIALAEYGNSPSLNAALRQSLDQAAAAAGLQSYEVPVDIMVETQPFTDEYGLLSGVGTLSRLLLTEHYWEWFEQMYRHRRRTG